MDHMGNPSSSSCRQNSMLNRLGNCGLVPRRDVNASGSGIGPLLSGRVGRVSGGSPQRSVGAGRLERVWAASGDNDDDNSLVTSGSLSPERGEEWKNWCGGPRLEK